MDQKTVHRNSPLSSKWNSFLKISLIFNSFFWSIEGVYSQNARSVVATKTYTSPGTFTVTDLADITGFDPTSEIFSVANVDILIVGGGGGGGRAYGAGGGGGGQVRIESIDLNLGATLNITIGQGGVGARKPGNISDNGVDGGNSIVNLNSGNSSITYSANGGQGGQGGSSNTGYPGANSGNGNSGGASNPDTGNNRKGGGGGGSGSPGTSGEGNGVSSTGGNGGDGVFISIGGGYFGAGGGGNGRNGGNGGNGSGGNANPSGPGEDAGLNSGSGGGGGNDSSTGGNGANGIVVVQITYRILPVEFLYFNTFYNSNDRSSNLEWATAKEWDNSHFEIERALNTIKNWETIARVEGIGYSKELVSYNFTDKELPITGGNVFYRLKQVDFNGNFNYSNTNAIQVPSLKGSDKVWVAFPNPNSFGSETSIKLLKNELYQDEIIYFKIMNTMGHGVSNKVSSPQELSQLVSNYLNNNRIGVYILDIQWGTHSQQLKLIRE